MNLDETWDRKAEVSEEDNEILADKPNSPCTIQYHMPQFRSALKWDHFFPCLRTPK